MLRLNSRRRAASTKNRPLQSLGGGSRLHFEALEQRLFLAVTSVEPAIPFAPDGETNLAAVTSGPFTYGVANNVSNGWQTVSLGQSYASMVTVLTPNYDDSSIPLVARMEHLDAQSFRIRVDRTDGLAGGVPGIDVHYLVLEEGTYTQQQHGITMEAVAYESTVTDGRGSWNGEARSYQNSYVNPVVLGQVMSYNDTDFSTFWSRGDSRSEAPDSSELRVGKHVGEDTDDTRSAETVGYVVIEAGDYQLGNLHLFAELGGDSISSIGNGPFNYSISGFSDPQAVAASQAGMDGGNGSWTLLHGNNPLSSTSIALSVDEDQAGDGERNHTTEQVAFVVLETVDTGNVPPSDIAIDGTAVTENVTGAVVGNVTVTDPDETGSHLLAVNDSRFEISAGQLKLQNGVSLNHEAEPSVNLTITATDSGGLEYSEAFTVTVADVNEVPTDLTLDNNSLPGGVAGATVGNVGVQDPDAGDSFSFDVSDNRFEVSAGVLRLTAGNSIDAGSEPTVALDITVTDSGGLEYSEEFTLQVNAPGVVPPLFTHGVLDSVTNSWQQVVLPDDYQSMVVVLTPNYGASSVPLVPRMRVISDDTFEVRVDRADNNSGAVPPISVHYVAVEEGSYSQAQDGITMEAVTFNSATTDHSSSWNGQARTYQNNYSNPVVIGQVMTYADPDPSVFWSRGSSRQSIPTASDLSVGKHVGEDSDTTRADETIGYIVVEAGTYSIDGYQIFADVGGDSVRGVTNGGPYSYGLSGANDPETAVVSMTAMDGANGGWALLAGNDPLSSSGLDLWVDEDQFSDNERSHTTEQVAYLVFDSESSPPPPPPPPVSEYQIEIEFPDNTLSPSQQAIFTAASARWSEIIVGDVPDGFVIGVGIVDDLVIEATAPFIDGVGNILGQAGPTWIRNGSNLPIAGVMQFDSADVANMEANGSMFDVILHEMGHVIGVGTIWDLQGLLQGAGGSNPRFTGAGATAEYNAIFGNSSSSVPVANTGGPGTRDAHWRESVFANELMTGYLNAGSNPLSRVSVASLDDLGYEVDLGAADPYSPPASGLGLGGDDGAYTGGGILLRDDSDHDDLDHSHDHDHVHGEIEIQVLPRMVLPYGWEVKTALSSLESPAPTGPQSPLPSGRPKPDWETTLSREARSDTRFEFFTGSQGLNKKSNLPQLDAWRDHWEVPENALDGALAQLGAVEVR